MTKRAEDNIEKWFEKADHDLIAAKNLIKVKPNILDIACFHCQQAMEKYLKAYLVFKNQSIPKVHNIDFLLKKCSKFDIAFEDIDVKNINVYAVRARYPLDSIMPTLKETKEYYKIANEIKKLVLKKTIH